MNKIYCMRTFLFKMNLTTYLTFLFLYSLVPVCVGWESSLTNRRHKLFVKISKANATITYYQHRLAINNWVQIPCAHPTHGIYTNTTDPVAFEWLVNGRQILANLPLIYAQWDLDGSLTILTSIPREYTLWCHARLGDDSDEPDSYFGHQIKFFAEPVRQLIVGIQVNLTMELEAWDRKSNMEEYTCDSQRFTGRNATERFEPGLENQFVRVAIHEKALATCQKMEFCQTFSVDQFECINIENNLTALHYAEVSFFLDGGSQSSITSSKKHLNSDDMHKMLYGEIDSTTEDLCNTIRNYTWDTVFAKSSTCRIATYHSFYSFCMGYAGSINFETDECDLCPPGSYGDVRVINPPLPYRAYNYTPLRSDLPHAAQMAAKKALIPNWLDMEEKAVCRSCPVNTYAEEPGRPLCLPCPVWHMRPTDPGDANEFVGAAQWLHQACPREGRTALRVVQVSRAMLGDRFATLVEKSNPLIRVGVLLALFLIPIIIALLLMFVAYMLIDVGLVLVKMANELLPLQIQLAETTKATAAFNAENQKAADEVYVRMQGESK
ncbi:hypothetical protein T265_09504 [Opisthorchis viverrini]|uniref:Tyrosine-protein kinase ephrin type A/B receptor-like domain-containing protein n=1 Tax=Opisthorchis viverrini TaxID=6198 RepID=A0A074Z5H8_OPIVI|nr:hypothetical protein T265_09504 [Opisthorchis viverrini]KER22386.1 hypothetical protein T265_09504 [Opisthorchis viverrini]